MFLWKWKDNEEDRPLFELDPAQLGLNLKLSYGDFIIPIQNLIGICAKYTMGSLDFDDVR